MALEALRALSSRQVSEARIQDAILSRSEETGEATKVTTSAVGVTVSSNFPSGSYSRIALDRLSGID